MTYLNWVFNERYIAQTTNPSVKPVIGEEVYCKDGVLRKVNRIIHDISGSIININVILE